MVFVVRSNYRTSFPIDESRFEEYSFFNVIFNEFENRIGRGNEGSVGRERKYEFVSWKTQEASMERGPRKRLKVGRKARDPVSRMIKKFFN